MIVESLSKNNQKIYKYQEPSKENKCSYFEHMIEVFEDYAEAAEIDVSTVEFDFKLLNEINIRVDRRKDYYIIYHDETYLNEVREAALTAFWILKFKPFLITQPDKSEYELNINCSFAAYVILSAVSEYVDRESHGKRKFTINNKEYLKRFKYALKYWDLSKEALMLISETLCEITLSTGDKVK